MAGEAVKLSIDLLYPNMFSVSFWTVCQDRFFPIGN